MSVCSDPDCPNGCASLQAYAGLQAFDPEEAVRRATRKVATATQLAMVALSTPEPYDGPRFHATGLYGASAKRAKNKAERLRKRRGRRGR